MKTVKQINETLTNLLDKLNEKDKYKYYSIYYIKDKEDDKIEAIAFKFPSFEEMCFEDIYIEEQLFIDDNFIHILDMRAFLVNKPLGTSIINKNYPIEEFSKEGVKNLFITYLNSTKKDNINIYSTLTPTERVALKSIYNTIGIEGVISISKLLQNTKASRITFNNLLNTLLMNGCAEVVSKGVKGTYIKITDTQLIESLSQSKEN